jgi:outer membrane protein assembly factor BamE (lipoprotein component of BamABCDE complex)
VAVLTLLVPASVATVEKGTVSVNRGAAGITLGMTRATVVAKLGKPLYQNANGFMQYSKKNLFDVYLNTSTNRVRLIGISGPKFCTTKGVCMFAKGGLAKMKAQYGKALKRKTLESGEKTWVIEGRFGARRVFTAFDTGPKGEIGQFFIGYCPPLPTNCGT